MGARVTEGLARHVSRAGAALAGQLRLYNQHLSTDVGATFLAIGALLLIAAWLLDHRTVVIALAVYLVYAVPHTVFTCSTTTCSPPANGSSRASS